MLSYTYNYFQKSKSFLQNSVFNTETKTFWICFMALMASLDLTFYGSIKLGEYLYCPLTAVVKDIFGKVTGKNKEKSLWADAGNSLMTLSIGVLLFVSSILLYRNISINLNKKLEQDRIELLNRGNRIDYLEDGEVIRRPDVSVGGRLQQFSLSEDDYNLTNYGTPSRPRRRSGVQMGLKRQIDKD